MATFNTSPLVICHNCGATVPECLTQKVYSTHLCETCHKELGEVVSILTSPLFRS